MPNSLQSLRVVICYKNFASVKGISHIGLGVAALNNAKWLQAAGIRTEIVPLKYPEDLRKFLNLQQSDPSAPPVTHVIVSAPWMPTNMLRYLAATFPTVNFAMNCHSNVGFLQADTNGIRLIRENLALQSGTYNFRVAGNSKRFCKFIVDAYGNPCAYLPNMYFVDGSTVVHRPGWPITRGVLRLGAYGAIRSQKNLLVAAASAIEISRELKAQVEFHINSQRDDGPETKRILRAIQMMISGLPNITLVQDGWPSWPDFRRIVGNNHVLLNTSYTESFCMVAADGVAEGVPSVVSSAITWLPNNWKADVDDCFDVARCAIAQINDPMAPLSGYRALRAHNRDSLRAWFKFLEVDPTYLGRVENMHFADAGDLSL